MKLKAPLDFQLQCGCFLQVAKGVRAQGMEIRGLSMFADKKGNSGLTVPVIKNIPLSKDFDVRGWINFNFCPFCGKQIAVKLIRKVSDETEPKAKPDA